MFYNKKIIITSTTTRANAILFRPVTFALTKIFDPVNGRLFRKVVHELDWNCHCWGENCKVNDILSWALITFLRKAQFSFQVCTRRNSHLRFADCLSNSNSESKLLVSSKSICRTFAILREQQLLIAHFSNIRHHHHVFCVLSFCFTFPHLPTTVQYQQLFA